MWPSQNLRLPGVASAVYSPLLLPGLDLPACRVRQTQGPPSAVATRVWGGAKCPGQEQGTHQSL